MQRFTQANQWSEEPGTRVTAIAPDLIGFGSSDKPVLEYTPRLHLNILQLILKEYSTASHEALSKPAELYLVGHSMGGILALQLAGQLVGPRRHSPETAGLEVKGLALLAAPFATPRHDVRGEMLRSFSDRLMLSHAALCWPVHHLLTLIWPGLRFLVARGYIKPGLPPAVVEDYMRHTCQSYRSNANQCIFENNLDPVIARLKQFGEPPTLLVYSQSDRQVPARHGQELSALLDASQLKLFQKETSHNRLGQDALDQVFKFFFDGMS